MALRALADKTWTHPVRGGEVRFAAVTIERWYYTAQRAKDDPVGVLRRAVRKDCGKVTLATALAELLRKQYHDHQHWSYLGETAEDLVHGLSQAIQKRGLPRALLTDNGAAMIADEVTAGLLRLGIVHEKTLPYSPYQNGKQECFWASLEGRLMEMLGGVRELSLEFLNEATQAWVEVEYNRRTHREICCSPVERFAQASDVLRPSPSSAALRDAFRMEGPRTQRQSDGTISVEGKRFEIPARYRHFRKVSVRYARWDLRRVDLVDPRNGTRSRRSFPARGCWWTWP